ncbi:uncharacterized protein LOC122090717 isoform X2 [Macadamia integrifolia]|uniref:uncharacterized protein LOC122090717 isoform X2 n=1 Tax=Macadamia integrifolia TaxID=60698 RepID=UPI001C4F0DCD|nr:uncharacterized protein LOC122090717 isoform X2 [Macadamia integrifolia]
MNYCGYQKNTLTACEDMRSAKDVVVCPKPRRISGFNHVVHDPRPLRWQLSHQAELCDSKAGSELLDMILTKGVYGGEQSTAQVASSPPFFSGSPPSRATNPLIQDARFGDEKLTSLSPLQVSVPSGLSSSPSSARKGGGCARMKFGHKPAAVRIEGFDCLDRDRRNCSIPAVA